KNHVRTRTVPRPNIQNGRTQSRHTPLRKRQTRLHRSQTTTRRLRRRPQTPQNTRRPRTNILRINPTNPNSLFLARPNLPQNRPKLLLINRPQLTQSASNLSDAQQRVNRNPALRQPLPPPFLTIQQHTRIRHQPPLRDNGLRRL